MYYQIISKITRIGIRLGIALLIATSTATQTATAQKAAAQKVPALCKTAEQKAGYNLMLEQGKDAAKLHITGAGADGLTCEELVAAYREVHDGARTFALCLRAGLEDGARTVLDAATCFEPPAEPEPIVLHPGGTFRSNAALEELRGVTRITGDLHLRDGVSDLSALSSLRAVGGGLSVGGFVDQERRGTALTSLTGLESLTDVGGNLLVRVNAALTSLTGLQSLTSVGGSLRVDRNPALTSLDGLESLTSVGGGLDVFGNRALTSLTGLQSLTEVGGDLSVGGNRLLPSLDGLDSLTSVGGSLGVFDNRALTSLTGLPPEFHGRVRGF